MSWSDDWDWLRDPSYWPETREFIVAEREYTSSQRDLSVGRLDVFDKRDRMDETPVWSRHGDWEYRWVSSGRSSVLVRRSVGGRREQPVFFPDVYSKSVGFRLRDVSIDAAGSFAVVLFDRDGSETLSYRLRDLDRNVDLGVEINDVLDVVWCERPGLLGRVERTDDGAVIKLTDVLHGNGTDVAQLLLGPEARGPVETMRTSDGAHTLVLLTLEEGDAVHVLDTASWPDTTAQGRPGMRTVSDPVSLRVVVPASEALRINRSGSAPGLHDGSLYMLVSSDTHPCGAVLRAAVENDGSWLWTTWKVPDPEVVFESLHVLERALVLTERHSFATRLRILHADDPDGRLIEPDPLPTHEIFLVGNPPYDARLVEYGCTSLIEPAKTRTLDLTDRHSASAEGRQPRIHGYNAQDYVVERRSAPASDGTSIPLSIAHHRELSLDGSAPGVLFGYGAYGTVSSTANTDLHRALLKNGAVCAIAHVRGGGELGPSWHEAARGRTKGVSIDDFLACAHELVDHGYVASDRLASWGGSAGGLLVCGAMVREPQLFRAVVAMVPFVDVLTALVTSADGRHEFGDPFESPQVLDAIRAYCPYQNLSPNSYPAMFVSAAMNDVRVRYWHALKWVAKLRAMRSDNRRTILRLSNEGGHLNAGASVIRNASSAALGFIATELTL